MPSNRYPEKFFNLSSLFSTAKPKPVFVAKLKEARQ